MIERVLQRLRAGDGAALAGTDLLIRLPVRQELVNAILARQTPDLVREMRLTFLGDNRAILHLEIDAPVVGLTRRELSLRIEGDLRPGVQDVLDFVILDGLKLFDKPIIQLARGMIDEQLPAGIDLSSKRLRLHFSQVLTGMGYDYLLPLIRSARLETHPEQLQLLLHLQAEPNP